MKSRIIKSLLIWLGLSPVILLSLAPFIVMFSTAVKPRTELFAGTWFPSKIQWVNFVDMWDKTGFGPALSNSLYISTVATVLTLLVTISAGYALSRYRFKGRDFFRRFLLVSQMLSPIVLVLGLFRLLVWVGVLNSVNAVAVVYVGFNAAFAVWMLESYFSTISKDIEEAAWMEGASAMQAMWRIFLPLALPAIVVTALFTFVNSWNEFVIALTMLRSDETYTLPIKIVSLSARYEVLWHHIMAATLLATVPVAIIFAWLQKYMLQGLTAGAVK